MCSGSTAILVIAVVVLGAAAGVLLGLLHVYLRKD